MHPEALEGRGLKKILVILFCDRYIISITKNHHSVHGDPSPELVEGSGLKVPRSPRLPAIVLTKAGNALRSRVYRGVESMSEYRAFSLF